MLKMPFFVKTENDHRYEEEEGGRKKNSLSLLGLIFETYEYTCIMKDIITWND